MASVIPAQKEEEILQLGPKDSWEFLGHWLTKESTRLNFCVPADGSCWAWDSLTRQENPRALKWLVDREGPTLPNRCRPSGTVLYLSTTEYSELIQVLSATLRGSKTTEFYGQRKTIKKLAFWIAYGGGFLSPHQKVPIQADFEFNLSRDEFNLELRGS
jgi:hypothetical protein